MPLPIVHPQLTLMKLWKNFYGNIYWNSLIIGIKYLINETVPKDSIKRRLKKPFLPSHSALIGCRKSVFAHWRAFSSAISTKIRALILSSTRFIIVISRLFCDRSFVNNYFLLIVKIDHISKDYITEMYFSRSEYQICQIHKYKLAEIEKENFSLKFNLRRSFYSYR